MAGFFVSGIGTALCFLCNARLIKLDFDAKKQCAVCVLATKIVT